MIANSIATTAELNGADPECCFLYLLIEMPKYQKRGDSPDEYLLKMMCWSEEYKAFEVESCIRRVLKNDGIPVYFQPIWDTKTGAIVAAEALMRVTDKELG